MIVFLNGKFVPEEQATVSVFDRSFLYGDGLFETIRFVNGQPFYWQEHMARLQRGAEFLKLKILFEPAELLQHARLLTRENKMPDALVRITLSRGTGIRGYSPRGAEHPVLVMTVAPVPIPNDDEMPRWNVIIASPKLPADEPLAEFKTCNKLPQILARSEADGLGADEALLVNTRGEVVEAASSNLFWIQGDCVITPELSAGVLAGVTRLAVLKICREKHLPFREDSVTPAELAMADGAFLSMSSWGIVEIGSINGRDIARSLLTRTVWSGYRELLHTSSDKN